MNELRWFERSMLGVLAHCGALTVACAATAAPSPSAPAPAKPAPAPAKPVPAKPAAAPAPAKSPAPAAAPAGNGARAATSPEAKAAIAAFESIPECMKARALRKKGPSPEFEKYAAVCEQKFLALVPDPPPTRTAGGATPGGQPSRQVAAAPEVSNAGTPAQRLARDVANATAANVDMKVLGVSLGKPLTLPECGSELSVGHSCYGTRASAGLDGDPILNFAKNLSRMTSGSEPVALPPGATTLPLSIAPAERPEWFAACDVSVTLVDGYVVAMRIAPLPPGNSAAVVQKVSAKYHRSATPGYTVRCVNEYGLPVSAFVQQSWSLPGLSVVLIPTEAPVGFGCGSGDLRFETATFTAMRASMQQAREASEPQL